jgi:hypothetical protein
MECCGSVSSLDSDEDTKSLPFLELLPLGATSVVILSPSPGAFWVEAAGRRSLALI